MTPTELLLNEYGSIIDKKIVAIRPLLEEEMKDLYWNKSSGDIAFAVILDDGQVLVPSRDPECNGPGYLILAGLVDKES